MSLLTNASTNTRDTFRRRGLIASFISNCGVEPRDRYMRELSSVVRMDNYGTCFHNVDDSVTRSSADWLVLKEQALTGYRFAIAFENKVGCGVTGETCTRFRYPPRTASEVCCTSSHHVPQPQHARVCRRCVFGTTAVSTSSHSPWVSRLSCVCVRAVVGVWAAVCLRRVQLAPGYVTEKVYNALRSGAIPIYLGADDINDFLPHPGSIINARDFANGEDLGRYVLAVAANETLFNSYLQWGTDDVRRLLQRQGCADSSYCQFCEFAAYRRRRRAAADGAAVPAPVSGNHAGPGYSRQLAV